MKIKDLRKKNILELNSDLLNSLREQFFMRMHAVRSGHVQRSHLFKKARRNVARIKTLLSEKANNND